MRKYLPNITNDEINQLPLYAYEGRVNIIDNDHNQDEIKKIIQNISGYVGFDTETKPNFKKGKKNENLISLVQIATKDEVYLFRTHIIGFPDYLSELFENKKIQKIGVAVKDDIKALKKLKHFNSNGFIDLADYVEKFDIEEKGLRKLAGIILGKRISKSQQLSNWENDILTPAQIRYAATDAWICFRIYKTLRNSVHENKSHS